MKEIKINEVTYTIPENWNELSKRQFIMICKLQCDNRAERQIVTLICLLGCSIWKWRDRQKVAEIKNLPGELLHTLLLDRSLLGWIWDRADFERYFVPLFWHRAWLMVGPPKHILNINASELTLAYGYLKLYSDLNKEEYLNGLVALLYRPMNPVWWLSVFKYAFGGEKRMSLNAFLFERRKNSFAKLPIWLRTAVFLQFSSAWAKLEKEEKYRFLFNKFDEQDKPAKDDPYAWEKIMMKMAESGVFGSFKDVQRMDADKFLLCMQRNIEEYLMQKDLMTSNK